MSRLYNAASTQQDLLIMALCPCRKSFHTVPSYLSFQQSHLTSQIFLPLLLLLRSCSSSSSSRRRSSRSSNWKRKYVKEVLDELAKSFLFTFRPTDGVAGRFSEYAANSAPKFALGFSYLFKKKDWRRGRPNFPKKRNTIKKTKKKLK